MDPLTASIAQGIAAAVLKAVADELEKHRHATVADINIPALRAAGDRLSDWLRDQGGVRGGGGADTAG